jgi:hypothetical protein
MITEAEFASEAEEVLNFLFTKGFGTCRSDGYGGYTVEFQFRTLADAQKAYRDLCMSYMKDVARRAEADQVDISTVVEALEGKK